MDLVKPRRGSSKATAWRMLERGCAGEEEGWFPPPFSRATKKKGTVYRLLTPYPTMRALFVPRRRKKRATSIVPRRVRPVATNVGWVARRRIVRPGFRRIRRLTTQLSITRFVIRVARRFGRETENSVPGGLRNQVSKPRS